MYKVAKYPHGAFSWADNAAADLEVAKAFYVDLFGWSKNEIPIGENMTYTRDSITRLPPRMRVLHSLTDASLVLTTFGR